MRNYLVLTGFLIGIMISVILVGRQIVIAYENSIHAEVETKLLETKAFEAQLKKRNEEVRTINIILVGDVMLSRSVGKKMEAANDYRFPFLKISDFLKTADIVFGNLEGPISDKGVDQGSIYSFRANPRVVEGLNFANFTILSLANNHIWDYGKIALLDTLKILKNNYLVPVGVGENYEQANEMKVNDVNGINIGFLAYTMLLPKSMEAGRDYPGISSFDLQKISKKISEAKAGGLADIIFVSLHWGDEYEVIPNEQQKEIARKLIDAGADVIIGHHPHVVQESEVYKTGLIFYSLGNFVFDQNFSDETMSGNLVKIEVLDKKITKWEVIKTKLNKDFQVEIGYN